MIKRTTGRASTVSPNRGFTLIEVMLALSIFSLAALAALQVANEHLRALNHVETHMFAHMVASNRLAQLHSSGEWPPQNEQKGQVRLAGREWYWQQQVVETVTDGLREVTVVVRESEGGDDVASLSGYLGQR